VSDEQSPSLLAVPNVSEGRDEAVIGRLAGAFAVEATLLDSHSDEIHNRTVLTLAPTAGDLVPALAGGARAAVEALDVGAHRGEHPRIGALDVAPVVWLAPEAREAARDQAVRAAEAIAALEVPVFLYGELASAPERRERAHFRSGGIDALATRMKAGELPPDYGPGAPHPTAGATLVTARPPLAAFNLELEGASLAATREIATELREAGGGLPGVRAIGLEFGDRTQVSTNVHDPVAMPLAKVVERTAELAEQHGGTVVAAEIVGLIPAAALAGFPADLPTPGFDRSRGVIEERLRQLAGS
jgi:glutamate formiminotransferase / 5-formyltetrahydrofolate cyclo-ligase